MPIKLKDDLAKVKTLGDEIEVLCEKLGIKTNAGRTFVHYSLANSLLMDRKQQDYGPSNIAGFGVFGVVVRMNDKMERLKTLFNNSRRRQAVNESISDTFRDIGNYGNIAQMVENNDWPNE